MDSVHFLQRLVHVGHVTFLCLVNSVSERSCSFPLGIYKERPCFADLQLIVHHFPLRHCPLGKTFAVADSEVNQTGIAVTVTRNLFLCSFDLSICKTQTVAANWCPGNPIEFGIHRFHLREFTVKSVDITPAQMLQTYLAATIRMEHEKTSQFDPNKISIYIVECGQATRNRAKTLHDALGLSNYDKSIPVIFVFHKGKVKTVYTYYRSPGGGGGTLRAFVESLLEPVVEQSF